MGSYFVLRVGDFVVHSEKNYLPEDAFLAFQRSDLITSGDGEDATFEYHATAGTVARRLDLVGQTPAVARSAFAKGYEIFARDLAGIDEQSRESVERRVPAALRVAAEGFETWRENMSIVLDAARRGQPLSAEAVEDEVLRFLLDGEGTAFDLYVEHGFVSVAPLLILRAIIELVPEDEEVTLDVTELVHGGWLNADAAHFDLDKGAVVIVTEGKSDSRLLGESLEVLMPEYSRFMRFIDFETANAKGGTGELVNFVRMFIGCGIVNRIVVLFDNDAAGHDALRQLGNLPPNVFAMTYPELDAARSYPTLGPDGAGISDINGRACSLELYLGADALRDLRGDIVPVRWTGYVAGAKRYQGEITAKGEVQKRYEEKLAQVRSDPTTRASLDFSGVEAIFDAIFAAARGS